MGDVVEEVTYRTEVVAGDDLEPVPENARLQVDVEEHSDQSVLEARLAYEWLISAVRARGSAPAPESTTDRRLVLLMSSDLGCGQAFVPVSCLSASDQRRP